MTVSNGVFLLLTMSGPCGIRSSAVKKLKPMFWPGDQRKMEFLGFVLGHNNSLVTDSTVQLGLLALIGDTPSTPPSPSIFNLSIHSSFHLHSGLHPLPLSASSMHPSSIHSFSHLQQSMSYIWSMGRALQVPRFSSNFLAALSYHL